MMAILCLTAHREFTQVYGKSMTALMLSASLYSKSRPETGAFRNSLLTTTGARLRNPFVPEEFHRQDNHAGKFHLPDTEGASSPLPL